MVSQISWENIKVGDEIPALPKVATTQMLVKWAGATGDFNPIHYEDGFAAAHGIGKPIIHGQLKRAWLVQLITDWIGRAGTIEKFSCQFKAIDYPRQMKSMTEPAEGETHWCKGLVKKKYADGDKHYLECEMWIQNGKGEKTTLANATIIFR